MPEDLETRTVMTPRTGTKICILIGLAFIVVAAYFYFVPATSVHTESGSVFGCGTAADPSTSTFAKGTCWRVTDVEKYRAIASAAIGILTIVLGAVMFGVDRRTETRRARRTDGYADDDRPRSADRDRRGWDDEPRRRQDDEPRRRPDDERPDRTERTDDDSEDRVSNGERDRDDRERDYRDARATDDADREESRRERRRSRRDWDDDRD